jgi:hypothetical protein
MSMKLYNISKSRSSCSLNVTRHCKGFAMVTALVVTTVMFVIVGSLATTRQMWGFFSTKQLDKSNVELPARADSANWLRKNRLDLFSNGEIASRIYLSSGEVARVDYMQYSGFGADPQPFPPLMPNYPDYDSNNFTLQVVDFYSQLAGENALTYPQGAYDPFYGVPNFGGLFWTSFRREMPEDIRQVREGRFAPETTQLRAWASIDSALVSDVSYRRLPVSAFTLYAVPVGSFNNVVDISLGLLPLELPYSGSGYTVADAGIGRVYVDGVTDFSSNAVTLGFPIVSTMGFTNIGEINLVFPTHLGGGTHSITATNYNLKAHRYLKYRGMLADSADRPQRLISSFLENASPFPAQSFAQFVNTQFYANPLSTVVRCSLNTASTNNIVQVTATHPTLFNSSDIVHIESTNVWQVDHTNKLVTLSFPTNYFNSSIFSLPPASIFFNFTGPSAADYKLRVNIPSLAALSADPSRQKFTIVTTNTLVLPPGGFNINASGTGAMLVAPRIVQESGAGLIGGVVITTARNHAAAVYPQPTNVSLVAVDLVGSLVLFVDPTQPLNYHPLRLYPDANYLSGASIPPAVPATLDFRLRNEDIQVYTMYATTNGAILP